MKIEINLFTVVQGGMILLKLAGVLKWSWFWVLCPMIMYVAVVLGGILVLLTLWIAELGQYWNNFWCKALFVVIVLTVCIAAQGMFIGLGNS